MKVRIFGRERWDLTELRKHFGVVGTDLPGERTAVTTGLDAVIAGFFSASTLWPNLHVTDEMRERAAEALERIDATRLAGRLVGEMSAGEKRRILIARGAGASAETVAARRALECARSCGTARPARNDAAAGAGGNRAGAGDASSGDIMPEIKRVILMRDGRIVGDGPREELLTEPRLSELFSAPVRIGRDELAA